MPGRSRQFGGGQQGGQGGDNRGDRGGRRDRRDRRDGGRGVERLPRLVGLRQALRMILEGSTLSAKKAAAVGLVDAAIPAASFDAAPTPPASRSRVRDGFQ